jgi:glycine betaine monooxygenase B
MPRESLEMPVELATMELPDTKTIRLKWPDGHDPEFKTGQFITLYWPDTPNYKRAYSLSSCALDRGFYEVTVKRDGKMGTRIVDWAKPGDKMFVIPPVGKFLPVYEPNKLLLCIAGGSGVTPFRAYVREATRRKLETKIIILYSVRQPKDIIFNNEFRELEKENPHFKFHVTCTRATPEDNWTGRKGRVTPEWIREHVTDLSNTVFYACGPNALVDFAEELVRQGMGVSKEQMKTEKWG